MIRNILAKTLFVLGVSALVAACNPLDSLIGPGKSDVEYRVTGTAARVSIRYQTEDGTSENSSTALPWSFSRKASDKDELYVSAQILEGDGTVTAAIYKEDKLLNSSTSTGTGAIATASGNLK
jgi:hypothetical protein